MGKLEQLFGPMLRGPLSTKANSSANQWAGRTAIASGAVSQVVSTTAVKSNCLISFNIQATTVPVSGTVITPIEVVSLSSGSFFTFGSADGSKIPHGVTVMWQIYKTD